MKRAVVLAAVLALALPAITFAQAPDFSGTWKLDMSKSTMPQRGGGGGGGGAPGGGGGGGGMGDLTIKQTKDTLTIEQSMGGNAVTRTYKLDGTESTNTVMGRGGSSEIKIKSKWEGSKLVSEWQQAGRGGDMQTVKESIYMEGGNLVRETDRGGNVTKLVFTKGM
jgi:hypothetical protein